MQELKSHVAPVVVAAILSLILAPVSFGVDQAANRKSPQKRQKAKPAPIETQVPTGPLTPLTLAETPASPPQVTFRDGTLSIVAQNSTLADILRAVRQQTGASLEIPGSASERVVGKFGPGPSREVLTTLLNGSHFNYVILGTADNPNAMARVILMAKANDAALSDQVIAEQPPANNLPQNLDAVTASQEEADAAEQQVPDIEPAPVAEQPPQQQPPGVRTPEQLLQELQRQQRGGQPGQPFVNQQVPQNQEPTPND